MQDQKQSTKLSLKEQTKKFQTQALIQIEHNFFFLYPQMKQFFIVIGNLQVVSFLVTPTRSQQSLKNTMNSSIGASTHQFMNLIPLVTRPYTFISEVGGQAQNSEFRKFLFLIVLAWILITMITLIIMQIYFKQQDRKLKNLNRSEKIQQLPLPLLLSVYMISWSLEMLNVILIVPALEICLESFAFSRDLFFQNNNQDQGSNYFISFLSIFTVVLLFGINILRFFITEETITLSMRGYEKLNLTVLEMILFILKSGQVFIFIFVSDNSIALYLQIIIAICITITTIFNLLIFHSQWNSRQIETILVTYCFNISVILVYLVAQITQIPQNQFVASMILLNFGFMAQLSLKYKIELDLKSLYPKYLKKIDDPVLLQFQIAQNLLCQQYSQTTKVFLQRVSIFVVTSTIINIETQIYLNKYSQTATLFKQFSYVGFYLPNLFLSRETLYNWSIVNLFLNNDDKEAIYNQINLSYQNIEAFISLMNFFNPDLYLLTDTFIQQFNNVKTQSLCNFLEPYKQSFKIEFNLIIPVRIFFYYTECNLFELVNLLHFFKLRLNKLVFKCIFYNKRLFFKYYCANSFQGVLQRGLVITLDTFQAHFHTEQQVNNFTVRSDISNLQIEAEFITQKVTEFLKTNLKIGLVSLTQDHIAFIQNLCIFLIIFSLVGIIITNTSILKSLRHEYMIHKRSILLMPTTSLFFDDQFERQVRFILVKEHII